MSWLSVFFQRILSLKRRWIGLIIGCVLWLAWMLFGFWSTLLLIILGGVGYAAGRVLEEQATWKQIVDKLLSERYGE